MDTEKNKKSDEIFEKIITKTQQELQSDLKELLEDVVKMKQMAE